MNIIWKRLLPHLGASYTQISFVMVLVFIGAAIASLLPWPMKLIVDSVFHGETLPEQFNQLVDTTSLSSGFITLTILAVAGLLLHILQRGVQMLQGWVETGVGEKLLYSLGEEMLRKLQKLSLFYHGKHPSGDLIRRVTTDTQCLQEIVLGVFVPVLTSTVTLLMMFLIMWQIDSTLTLVALCAALPIPFLIRALSPRMTKHTYDHQQSEGRVMSLAEQTLTGLPVIQAFGQEERQHNHFKQLSERSKKDYLKSVKAQLEFSVGVSSSTAIGSAVMMWIGGYAVLKGTLTLGELLVFLSYVASLYGPIEVLAYVSSTYATAVARVQRVFEVLDEVPSVINSGTTRIPSMTDSSTPAVQFSDICFGYTDDQQTLNNVNLSVATGETIAFVGTTGSGKSTLVSLIPRFYDPVHGTVKINGVDLKEATLRSVRSNISMVLQDAYLLPLTIAENIAYGNPDADMDSIISAAKASNAHEFVSKLPLGYETVLSEHGSDLSGGQRQRLAIARAILKDAPILILDEPTSALDVTTEALFFEALDRLKKNRTSFIIAHRLSTIKSADRIVVLDEGRIIEVGTHEELLKIKGAYHSLCEIQSGITNLAA